MAYSTTYTALKADILAWTEEDSAEFDAVIDKIIALGELKVLRELDLEMFQGEVSGVSAIVAGVVQATLPAGIVKINYIRIFQVSGALGNNTLIKRTDDFIRMFFEANAAAPVVSGTPKYYSEVGEGLINVAPLPDVNYTMKVHGIIRPAGLSGTTATTWLSINVGDLLLDACLIESEAFLTGEAPLEIWKDRYTEKLAAARLEFRGSERASYNGAGQASRTPGP